MGEHQFTLCLPPRAADEILAERLADLVAELNAETDPAERVRIHAEVSRLRRKFGGTG